MRFTECARCYWCYYKMYIYPLANGNAMISTCCNNTFRPQNRIFVNSHIKDVWNSPEFQFQRKSVSENNWSFCQGSSCCYESTFFERQMVVKPEVRGAIHRKETHLDYFAKNLMLAPSYQCNNNCYFCYQARQRKKRIHYELKKSLVKEIKEILFPLADWISFSGGEPFYTPLTRELIEWAITKYPYKQYSVVTNGTLLHAFGLKKIMENNLFISISVYGMYEGTYRAVTGTDNFSIVWDNIYKLLSAGYQNLRLNYVISKYTLVDLEDFCKFIEAHDTLRAAVSTDIFEGIAHQKIVKQFKNRFSHLFPRLRFRMRSETLTQRVIRRMHFSNIIRYNNWKYGLVSKNIPSYVKIPVK